VKIRDLVANSEQRTVYYLNDSRRQCRIVADELAHVSACDIRILGGLANTQGHFR
jgi:hypothetical protein